MVRIILIGYMGAGKTTLGKELAEKLGIPFIDSDTEIERKEGKTVSQIFESKGESYFRNLEAEFITELKNENDFVLATGGGMPCFNHQMEDLNKLGTTVYLKTSLETMVHRLREDAESRPLIAKLNPSELLAFIKQNLEQRENIYLDAQLILEEKDQSVESLIHLLHQRN